MKAFGMSEHVTIRSSGLSKGSIPLLKLLKNANRQRRKNSKRFQKLKKEIPKIAVSFFLQNSLKCEFLNFSTSIIVI